MSNSNSGYGCSASFGWGIPAMVLSYALNHSFWWMLLHGMFGWIYVLYAIIVRSHEILPALKAMFS